MGNLCNNGLLNNAKLKGQVWEAMRKHNDSCEYLHINSDVNINQIFNTCIWIGIYKLGIGIQREESPPPKVYI